MIEAHSWFPRSKKKFSGNLTYADPSGHRHDPSAICSFFRSRMHDERLRCGWHIPCKLGASRWFLSFAFHGRRSHPRIGSWLLEGTPRIRRVVASPNIDRVCRLYHVRCIRGVCFHVVVAHVPTSATSLFGFFLFLCGFDVCFLHVLAFAQQRRAWLRLDGRTAYFYWCF